MELWYRRLGYISNARDIEAFKLNNGIDILIENVQRIEGIFSKSERDEKDKKPELNLPNNEHQGLVVSMDITTTTLLNKITNSTNIDVEDSNIKQLCNPYIERKYIKIVRHMKMTTIFQKLKEIQTDLWGHTSRSCYQKELKSAYYSMSLLENHGFFY